jgi:DNA (cytosine-5)-methyltransferase 1
MNPTRFDLLSAWARRLPEGAPMEMYDTELPWIVYVYGRTQDRWWPFWNSTRVLGRMAVGCRCAVCGENHVVVTTIPRTGPIPDTGEHPERTRFKLDHLHRDRPHPMNLTSGRLEADPILSRRGRADGWLTLRGNRRLRSWLRASRDANALASRARPVLPRILNKRFPGAAQHPDVFDCTGDPRRWAEHGGTLLEHVDVLAGGFPCQAVSNNGHGLVQADERWLWPEYARLIRELRPRYVVVENVSALVRRGLGDILDDLAALRYDAEWDCLRASDAGAPHRRERLYLVAYPQRIGREEGPRVFTGQLDQDLPQPDTWRGVPDRNTDGALRLVPPPHVQRVADGLPDELDRLRATGNALLPQIPEFIGRRILEYEEGGIAA